MILYHGSNMVVKNPKIIRNEYGKDFGFGFYLTPIKDQAERMAKRTVKREGIGKPIVSIFEWNEDKKTLRCLCFKKPDIEWLNLIISCRTNIKFVHNYDIVEGKIADDSVGATINYVINGIMEKETALKKLVFQKINSQIAFCTDKSLKSLVFKKSYEVK